MCSLLVGRSRNAPAEENYLQDYVSSYSVLPPVQLPTTTTNKLREGKMYLILSSDIDTSNTVDLSLNSLSHASP